MAMLNFLPKLIQIVERPQEPARPFEPVAIANPPAAWIELTDEPIVIGEARAGAAEETLASAVGEPREPYVRPGRK